VGGLGPDPVENSWRTLGQRGSSRPCDRDLIKIRAQRARPANVLLELPRRARDRRSARLRVFYSSSSSATATQYISFISRTLHEHLSSYSCHTRHTGFPTRSKTTPTCILELPVAYIQHYGIEIHPRPQVYYRYTSSSMHVLVRPPEKIALFVRL
jgi:hypothetical protein